MLFVAFIAILGLTFGVMAFFSGPSQSQKAIDKRLAEIRSPAVAADSGQNSVTQILKVEHTSRFGWLEDLLQKYQISRKIEIRIAQADSKTTVVKLLFSCVALALVGFGVMALLFPILPVELAVSGFLGYIPFGLVSFKRNRRVNAFNAALPDAIDMMGRALRAGHSLNASLQILAEQSVEPVCSEFREVFKQQNFGVPLRDALTQMLDHVPSQDLRVLVTGILVQKETGGNLAEILDRTVHVIRERLRIHGEIKTHTAQGRMTGWILCALPIVMFLVINMVNPGYSHVLVDTPFGHKLLYIGITLLTVGGFVIRQIVNGIEV